MPGMPDLIQKSGVMRRMEIFSQVPSNAGSALLDTVIDGLQADPNGDALDAIAIGGGFYGDDTAAEHFRKHWLGKGPDAAPFWPTIQDKVKKTLRNGMLQVAQTFQATAKPCQFLWVMSGPEGSTDWWMSVTEGETSIVAIFFTPLVPCDYELEDSKTVWVVKEQNGDYTPRPVKVPRWSEQPLGTPWSAAPQSKHTQPKGKTRKGSGRRQPKKK